MKWRLLRCAVVRQWKIRASRSVHCAILSDTHDLLSGVLLEDTCTIVDR